MTIKHNQKWVQIAYLDKQDRIFFTTEFLDIMGDLGWEAKAFVGHLLGLWYDPFEHMLDYAGGAKFTKDQPGDFTDLAGLHEPQDVVESWAVYWSQNPNYHKPAEEAGLSLDLGVEWYRDVLRAKLVSIKLPKKLLLEYKKKMLLLGNELNRDLGYRHDRYLYEEARKEK